MEGLSIIVVSLFDVDWTIEDACRRRVWQQRNVTQAMYDTLKFLATWKMLSSR